MSSNSNNQGWVWLSISTWLCLSMSLVLLNKWILYSLEFCEYHLANFYETLSSLFSDYPAFLATSHLMFNTICSQLIVLTGGHVTKNTKTYIGIMKHLKLFAPVAALMTFSIICGNMAYIQLSVAFIQMLKAFSPVAVYIISCISGAAALNAAKCLDIALISGGVVIATYGWSEPSAVGTLLQIVAVIADAVRLVLMQRILSTYDMNLEAFEMLYYLAPLSTLTGLLASLGLPFPSISEIQGAWIYVMGSCVLSFCLNMIGFSVIKKTSSLTLSVCGILKDIGLIVLSLVLWKDEITVVSCVGYGTTLLGIMHYRHSGRSEERSPRLGR
ncbi:triose-phosphate transporter family-domain-containing protein [Xylaria bambusicola]|uniref:triose-phosphate transporter family-domain-containing protein n=1 Tax=Xylaria bambusicola TaxID=326684 RepID=UPI002007207F|nr:triose-phosphate transporter family-domain-containing protein [Xylaria bambusicola]KAI0521688.1 triose-phosphate transporter family-domain-containing protein [Xylaria bambusicola]